MPLQGITERIQWTRVGQVTELLDLTRKPSSRWHTVLISLCHQVLKDKGVVKDGRVGGGGLIQRGGSSSLFVLPD